MVDHTDEVMLKSIHALLKAYESNSDYELSDEDKRIIDKRIANFSTGKDPGTPAHLASRRIRARLKAARK